MTTPDDRPPGPVGSGPSNPDRYGSRTPGWVPFDPGDIPALPPTFDGSGRIVAVTGSGDLVTLGWAVSVAIELARAWSEARSGVVLVDADLERPRMHHALRVANAPGLAEVLTGAAAVQEATRSVDPDRLYCVPAGIAPDEAGAAFEPRRWRKLCQAFSDAGITVVVFLPDNAPWATEVLTGATDLVRLEEAPPDSETGGGSKTATGAETEGRGPHLLATMGPMPFRRSLAPGRVDTVAAGPQLLHFVDESPAEPRGGDAREAPDSTGAGAEPELPAAPATIAQEATERYRSRLLRERERGKRGPGARLYLGLALLAGSVAFLVAMELGSRPLGGSDPEMFQPTSASAEPGPGDPVGGAPETAAPGPGPGRPEGADRTADPDNVPPAVPETVDSGAVRSGPPLRFSLGLAAYVDRERAERHVASLRTVAPGTPVAIAPVRVGGAVYHRVLAGFVDDTAAARELANGLSEATGTDPDRWIVRSTEIVVELGRYTAPDAAERNAASLIASGLPASVARVPHTDGSVWYHVYAGGYETVTEASYLLSLAEDLGVGAVVERRAGVPLGERR